MIVLNEYSRYNADVILGGTNPYDVMYHQHFLGSHKMIPLPSVGEYVRERLEKGMKRLSYSSVYNRDFHRCTF